MALTVGAPDARAGDDPRPVASLCAGEEGADDWLVEKATELGVGAADAGDDAAHRSPTSVKLERMEAIDRGGRAMRAYLAAHIDEP